MIYRLIVIGHKDTITEMKYMIEKQFKNISIITLSFNDDSKINEITQQLNELMPNSDGILYTRKDPYLVISSQFTHTIPVRFVEVKNSDFIRALFTDMIKHHKMSVHISIDSIDYNTVMECYQSLEIETNIVHPYIVDVNYSEDNYIEKVTQAHIRHYSPQTSTLCVTNIRAVYEKLQARNINVCLMRPDEDNIIHEVNSLLLEKRIECPSTFNTIAIAINIHKNRATYHASDNYLSETLALNKVYELISFYAQHHEALLIQSSQTDFTMIGDLNKIELLTENFKKFNLISEIEQVTPFATSIGIGYGNNHIEIMKNAQMGLHLSNKSGYNCVHIIYAPDQIVGPIHPVLQEQDLNQGFKRKLKVMSERTELSTNTLVKIQEFAETLGNDSFSSAELAHYIGISSRSANRILLKLIDHGYVIVLGKLSTSTKGRPTRLMKFV